MYIYLPSAHPATGLSWGTLGPGNPRRFYTKNHTREPQATQHAGGGRERQMTRLVPSVLYPLLFALYFVFSTLYTVSTLSALSLSLSFSVCLSLSSGLRPIPPPCLGGGSETSWVLVGISWLASRGPLGSSFETSWGPFWGLLGPLGGLLGPSWGLLGASWGFLGPSWGFLGHSLNRKPDF